MTLTEFLLARIAEDESQARMRIQSGEPKYAPVPWGCPSANRVLAECEAKRQIVDEHADYGSYGKTCQTCSESDIDNKPWPCPTLRALALPYADHPDCRDEWKP
ncbi:MAG: hypothetical protein JWN41_1836 [Thermoleophilia bacterium]|nr:hypothetical protein [Thermoleophilia bacterium]